MQLKNMLAILTLLISNSSLAVPLFGETAGTIRDGVLTLYKDSQDPHKLYFFPNSTKFSVDNTGTPLFNFAYWGLNPAKPADAGAYMTLTTHLSSDSSQQAALDNYIKSHPNDQIAVLPIKRSMIGLQTTESGASPLSNLFSEFNFAKVGGRAEDEIGINAILTPTGARVFKALLQKERGGSKLKFDYCYTIQGFGPNMNATVSVDMRRVYDYFEANAKTGWWWWSADIKRVVETLNDKRAIQITMNGGDATQWEALQKVSEVITRRLFVPELAASPVSPASSNRLFSFGASSIRKEELKNETWTWVHRDLEDREFCTAISIKDLDGHLDRLVTNAD